jgi:2-polyprenyl-3-methyl-5-hydroxy-6-metoxy-1,4-benzoquinol methylase
MPLLSSYAQKKKITYFMDDISKDARILEIGSGGGWLGEYLKGNGWQHVVGIDLEPPADIVGDICDWKDLSIEANSFDYIIAFEVVEHVDCFEACFNLLKPGGLLMLTSPVPHMDWACKMLEGVGLNQKRTSPHDHLIYFENIPLFEPVEIRRVGFMAQWGIFKKIL